MQIDCWLDRTYTSRRRRRAGGRRGADERYTGWKVKNKDLMPSLLGNGILPMILWNDLFSKSEACKRKQREDERAGERVREETGRRRENREGGFIFLVPTNQKHWVGLPVPWLRRSKALPEKWKLAAGFRKSESQTPKMPSRDNVMPKAEHESVPKAAPI